MSAENYVSDTHPESYYDAKRAARAATRVQGNQTFSDSVSDRMLTGILAALGWTAPGPAMDGTKKVRVFCADVRYRLPADIRDGLLMGKSRNTVLTGYLTAPTKTAAADVVQPSWLTGSKRTKDIREVDPSDYRYALAVEYPDHVVLTSDGSEFGTPVLITRAEMTGDR